VSRRRRAGTVLLAAGPLLPALALLAGVLFGEEVTILNRLHDEAAREEQRRVRDPRDDVAEIYGVPERGSLSVLWPRPERRILPAEDPGRVLLFVDRLGGESPLLARVVAAVAGVAGALLFVAGLGLLLSGSVSPRRLP
jgi:hypothetical protein